MVSSLVVNRTSFSSSGCIVSSGSFFCVGSSDPLFLDWSSSTAAVAAASVSSVDTVLLLFTLSFGLKRLPVQDEKKDDFVEESEE